MSRLAALIFVALLAACASTEFSSAPGSPAFPKYRGEVTLLDGFPEEGSYDSVGIVIARGTERQDKKDLIEVLKSEAAKRGADAIVLQGDIKTRSRGGIYREKLLGAYALRLNR